MFDTCPCPLCVVRRLTDPSRSHRGVVKVTSVPPTPEKTKIAETLERLARCQANLGLYLTVEEAADLRQAAFILRRL